MTYTIAVCTVKNSWLWTEELSEPYRVLFPKIFEELVHLVGFIIRIYRDARSPEGQIRVFFLSVNFHLVVISLISAHPTAFENLQP